MDCGDVVSARTLLEKDEQQMYSIRTHRVHYNFCLDQLISINPNIMPEAFLFEILSDKI